MFFGGEDEQRKGEEEDDSEEEEKADDEEQQDGQQEQQEQQQQQQEKPRKAERSTVLEVGDYLFAKWEQEILGVTIIKVHEGGVYDIRYDDGYIVRKADRSVFVGNHNPKGKRKASDESSGGGSKGKVWSELQSYDKEDLRGTYKKRRRQGKPKERGDIPVPKKLTAKSKGNTGVKTIRAKGGAVVKAKPPAKGKCQNRFMLPKWVSQNVMPKENATSRRRRRRGGEETETVTFASIWPALVEKGWGLKPGGKYDDWHWLRPGIADMQPGERERGFDYFVSEDEVRQFVLEQGIACNTSGSSATNSSNGEDSIRNGTSSPSSHGGSTERGEYVPLPDEHSSAMVKTFIPLSPEPLDKHAIANGFEVAAVDASLDEEVLTAQEAEDLLLGLTASVVEM
jgi:hypothetical protein